MKSWRMVALVLLGAQASVIAGAASPAAAVAPASVAAPTDDSVDAEGATAASSQALIAEQRITALMTRFNAALASVKSSATAEGRLVGYRSSLELFDQIRLDRPEFKFSVSLSAFASAYVDELNAARRSQSGIARARNLNEARAVLLRIEDRPTRVAKLLDIAQIESSSGDAAETLLTIESVLIESPVLSPQQSDEALSRAIEIAVQPKRDVPDNVYLWLEDIGSAELRSKGLRRIAEVEAAKDKVLVELMGSASLGADRDTRLLDISDFMTRKGRFDAALWTAMLTSDAVVKERDAALGVIVDDMIEAGADTIHAVHGIADTRERDSHLLDLIALHLDQEQLSEARRTAGFLKGASAVALGWSRVGLWLQGESYNRQAIAAADRAQKVLEASEGASASDSAAREVAYTALATLAAKVGQRPRAALLLKKIKRPENAFEVRLALIDSALSDEVEIEATVEVDRLPAGPSRDQATVKLIVHVLRDRRFEDASRLLGGINAPLPRLEALAAIIKALRPVAELKPDSPVQPSSASLMVEVDGLLAKLDKEGVFRSEAYALRAMTRAGTGNFPGARADLELALTAERFPKAFSFVLTRATMAQGVDAGLAMADIGLSQSSREKAREVVAVASAERGELVLATGIVRALSDDMTRVDAFLDIAKVAADRTDAYDLIDKVTKSDLLAADHARLKDLKLLTKTDGRQLFAMPNPELGKILPSLPPLARHTAASIARDVPAIGSAMLHVLPMQYSDFNEKFLPSLSYAFHDSANQLFYFDAQKTAFPVFLSLDQGVYDLPGIARFLRETGRSRYLVREGRRYILKLPILIGPGASLVISGADVEELRLVRDAGAFIVNAGKLSVYDTRIVGWDAKVDGPAEMAYENRENFRPFIVNWSGSTADVGRSTVTHLGFLGAKGYGLSFTAGPEELLKRSALNLRRPTGRLYNNSFQNMLYGLYTYEADNVSAVGNEYKDNLVYGLDPHDRSGFLLMAYNTAYGTRVKHGIIVSRGVDNSWIIGNLSFDNNGSGVMLDRDSVGNMVYANTSFMNKNDGVALFESPCNIIASNHVFANKRDGIKARNSWDIGIFGNQLVDNGGQAISGYTADLAAESLGHVRDFELDPYFKLSDIAVIDNLIKGNAGGVSLKDVFGYIWKGNDVVAQPRPYTGITKTLVNDMFKRSDRGLYVRTGCPQMPADYQCSFKVKGYLAGVSQYGDSLVPESSCEDLGSARVAAGPVTDAPKATP